jgi:hypothetical protein
MRDTGPAVIYVPLTVALLGVIADLPDGATRAGIEASRASRVGPPVAGEDGGLDRPATPAGGEERTALSIFERRILPIFRAESPSSCTECHLGGVELKDYTPPACGSTP